jgi:hypothetical protein
MPNPKNIMAKIAYIIINTEPTISHLKAIITPINRTSHGKALGKLLIPRCFQIPTSKKNQPKQGYNQQQNFNYDTYSVLFIFFIFFILA